jgi:hypothetical protein
VSKGKGPPAGRRQRPWGPWGPFGQVAASGICGVVSNRDGPRSFLAAKLFFDPLAAVADFLDRLFHRRHFTRQSGVAYFGMRRGLIRRPVPKRNGPSLGGYWDRNSLTGGLWGRIASRPHVNLPGNESFPAVAISGTGLFRSLVA